VLANAKNMVGQGPPYCLRGKALVMRGGLAGVYHLLLALLLVMPCAANAQQPLTPPELNYPHIFGLSADGEDYLTSQTKTASALKEVRAELRPAIEAGPEMIWRIVPGQWPVDFTAKRLNPAGDGQTMNFEGTDALVKTSIESGARIAAVFDPDDLALLGYSSMNNSTPSARVRFFNELAKRYAQPHPIKGIKSNDEDALYRSAIEQWQFRLNIFATPDGPQPKDALQFVLDVQAIQQSGARAGIVADIGEFSTDEPDAKFMQLLKFCQGALAPTLQSLCLDLRLDKPDMQYIIERLQKLRANTGRLPISYGSIKPGKQFAQNTPAIANVNWSAEKTAAAYVSATAGFIAAGSPGTTIYWDDAPATESLNRKLSPMAMAAGRLTHHLRPFYRGAIEQDGDVWRATYNRESEPESYLVFWDWANETNAAPMPKTYQLNIPQQTYRITPLVDECGTAAPGCESPDWAQARIVQSTKEGLTLQLGRSPLYIERAYLGRGLPVPLGMSKRMWDRTMGPSSQPESSPASQLITRP